MISLSMRYLLVGGMRNLPFDRERSLEEGYHVRIWDEGYTEKSSDYFRIDLKFKFTRNRPNYTAHWDLDIINLTNRQNMLNEYWDNSIRDFRKNYQNPLIPVLSYRIQF